MSLVINEKELAKILMDGINTEMNAAPEPVIQKAMADIEKEMRKRLAECLICYIENSFSIERYGQDLKILIKQAK